MMIDEQKESNQVAGRVLGKVNLVNDWAKRLRNELERKPTIQEVADKMGISPEQVTEAIRLSAEAIEDIDYVKPCRRQIQRQMFQINRLENQLPVTTFKNKI